MSTRAKLMLLVVVTCVANASSLFVRDVVERPISKIRQEESSLTQLNNRLLHFGIEVNRIGSEPFRGQMERARGEHDQILSAFKRVQSLVLLPSLNESVAVSIESIGAFAEEIEGAWRSLETRAETLVVAADERLGDGAGFTLPDLRQRVLEADPAPTRRWISSPSW